VPEEHEHQQPGELQGGADCGGGASVVGGDVSGDVGGRGFEVGGQIGLHQKDAADCQQGVEQPSERREHV
jgi:hypothetical protein